MAKVPLPNYKKVLHHVNGDTNDIIKVVMDVVKMPHANMAEFARQFPPTVNGLRKLHDTMMQRLMYKEDPSGVQLVQYPAHLWHSAIGDCKSYTVFISSILKNIGVPHIIRFTAYSRGHVTHVYPVALLDGYQIPIDVVLSQVENRNTFGTEKPYHHKRDFKP